MAEEASESPQRKVLCPRADQIELSKENLVIRRIGGQLMLGSARESKQYHSWCLSLESSRTTSKTGSLGQHPRYTLTLIRLRQYYSIHR